jgi:hypothetical protein
MSLNRKIHILIVGKSQWLLEESLNYYLYQRNNNQLIYLINSVSYRDFIANPNYECTYDYVIWVGFDMKFYKRKFNDYLNTSIELPITVLSNFINSCKNTHFIIIGSMARFNLFTRYGFAKQAIISHISFKKSNVFIIDPNTITVNNCVVIFGLKSRLIYRILKNFKFIKFESNISVINKLVDIIVIGLKCNSNINQLYFFSEPLNFSSISKLNFLFLKLARPILFERFISILYLIIVRFRKIIF